MSDEQWPELLKKSPEYVLQTPASAEEVDREFASMGLADSTELVALYKLSDGVFDSEGQWFVIWPLADLRENNEEAFHRGAYRGYVSFGDDGTGNAFLASPSNPSHVYHWSEIEEEATFLASSLKDFWVSLASGTLRL